MPEGLCPHEAIAPLAEETRDPRRTIARAILLSVTLMGIFFVLTVPRAANMPLLPVEQAGSEVRGL